jgi:hypothetical protein
MCEVCGSVLFSHALSCFDYVTWWWMIEVWIWNIRGLIMTGKNASILKKLWLNNALFTTDSWIDSDREKRKYSEKSWLNNALFTTNHK